LILKSAFKILYLKLFSEFHHIIEYINGLMFVLVLELVFYGVCMLVVRRWLILSMLWRKRDTEY